MFPAEHRVQQLADYLTSTLLDESQTVLHDETCTLLRADLYERRWCDCDATSEWQATVASIMEAVDQVRHLDDFGHALMILVALARPYEKGSGYPS